MVNKKGEFKMARKGENIYKRKDNRWEGRYIKGYDSFGKTIRGYVYGKTYAEVKEKLLYAKQNKIKYNSSGKNLSFYCDEWLSIRKNNVKHGTYVKYHSIVSNHIKIVLGDISVCNINTLVINNFSSKLLKNGLSSKSVKDILIVLGSILRYCKKQIPDFSDVEIIYPKEEKREMRVLNLQEQQKLISFLLKDIDEIKFGMLLSLFTGMRVGEICALKWENISLEERTVTVRDTMQRLQLLEEIGGKKTKVFVGSAKSDSSRRKIPLSSTIYNLCCVMKKEDDAFVLTGNKEHFFEPRLLQYRFNKYCAECELEGVHFHTLRHTFATRCAEVGFEVKSLSEILGHSNTKVTLDRYVHSSFELKRNNIEKLQAVGL